MDNTKRFIVEEISGSYKVYDTVKMVYITKPCLKEVAEEIAEDFEKMSNKDFSPLLKK
ncbi:MULTISPECIES: hypothetical protein [Sphingobacterium]|uniref:hypothetical protein n=1 Tax=Sphingobacterium TaxID=28453 RepID=UPI00257C8B1B|nr:MULTISPECIES: hypothetical protein [Sphingobacterium]